MGNRRRKPLEGGTIKGMLYRGNLIEKSTEHQNRLNQLERQTLTESAAGARFKRRGEERDYDGWGQQMVMANQTAVTLNRWGLSWQDTFIPTRDGSFTALELAVSLARTAGTLTVTVYVNGTATEFLAAINDEDTNFVEELASVGEFTFSAGDEITLRLTTTSGWLPVTANLQCRLQIATD